MRVAITGADGFLGWHVRCRAFALGMQCQPIGRRTLADPNRLASTLAGVDAVLHCAGVSRGTDLDVTEGNLQPARLLAAAARNAEQPVRIVYANSVQARSAESTRSGYGMAKRRAADILASASPALSDVILPNLFGEHGRPYHNSFVATFCHEIATGQEPVLTHDRDIPLLHAQDAADVLLQQATATGHRVVEPTAEPTGISTVLALIRQFAAVYTNGELPDLTDPFVARLFNTYRTHVFPTRYPIFATPRVDPRGTLVECVRTGATGGQGFFSSTMPGSTRGDHVHLRKFERFMVMSGQAEIALRRLFTNQVVRFPVCGDRPAIVDIPTMWAHRVTSTGDEPALTFFWSNELYSPDDPDTYPCPVGSAAAAGPTAKATA